MRAAVGDPLRRCPSCGCWEYGGAPDCPRCAGLVDAVFDRLICDQCSGPLGRRAGCPRCDVAHGMRYVARETDRPGVPPGNEHAIRVNVSVVRRPEGIPAPKMLGRRLLLPAMLAGFLPMTEQAQRLGALVKRGARAEDVAMAIDELAAAPG
ncbi:hypothetical protein [Microbispora hainanensis]|uniref:Uncharacterized protein n=1 Tax=Microbispora hainanensis TaxID=568844 RepID=A0A544Z1N6_9ACTN|nr:hypothetical protein [Microbispora hainanensis]TQS22928.1 hypothetical protein FLX08_06210 [Microbispora hainanensis]